MSSYFFKYPKLMYALTVKLYIFLSMLVYPCTVARVVSVCDDPVSSVCGEQMNRRRSLVVGDFTDMRIWT